MLQDLMNSWKAFSASCWLWKHFFLQKVVMMLEGSGSGWEVRWIWQMRQNLCSSVVQLFKCWLCGMWPGGVVERNWALLLTDTGCRRCSSRYISSICRAHFSDVMVSPEFRKQWISEQQQTNKQWLWPFFWCRFGLGKCFGAASWSSQWAGYHQLSYKIHFSLHITIRSRNVLLLLHRIR